MLSCLTYGGGEIEAQSGFTYWAGIWAEDAHAGLLWRTQWPVNVPAAYIAPSWSWASRDISSSNNAYNYGNYPAYGWKLDTSRFKANISSCEIITVNGNPNGRLLDAKLRLRTLCRHLNQWESLQDVVIANPNLRLPWILEENQILLIFDAEPSEKSWSLSLPIQVSALQRKAKSVLRWVSSSIYTLVAKWKTSPASLPRKTTQAPKRKIPTTRYSNDYLSRKQAIQRLSTVQRDSNYLTIVQIASLRDPAVEHLGYFDRNSQASSHASSAMCLLVQPGTEEGTLKRVGLAQISNFEYCDSLPWEMRTIVLV
ncbi:hypothetical protein BOTCAL_0017g00430 [Botryotinia calthae]|uniref:Heterokaryon incompatibility domain-containing protein n=1 Tax=Botryotinia calthae TaxID=38488 RepID=A0A4Y8DF76_9HELO|nr:hypothetical protein BOTCAL_0017g00430 [Botryotinia calthae]